MTLSQFDRVLRSLGFGTLPTSRMFELFDENGNGIVEYVGPPVCVLPLPHTRTLARTPARVGCIFGMPACPPPPPPLMYHMFRVCRAGTLTVVITLFALFARNVWGVSGTRNS